MFGRKLTKGFSLALGSFFVCNFSNANTSLSLEGLCGALVDNEAKDSWFIWFISFFPDFIQSMVLRRIGFFENDFLEKINRLSLGANERMKAEGYSEYAQERGEDNFLLEGFARCYFCDYFTDIIWDSYGYLELRSPEFPGEKIEFHGYNLFGVYFKNSLREKKWCWLTKDVKGKPILLMPSGVNDTDGETFEEKIPIDKKKIKERLPKIPVNIIDAQPDDLETEFNGHLFSNCH